MSILTVKPKPPLSVSVRHLLASQPFVAFFVLTFVGSWLFFAPIVLGQNGLALLPYSVPFWLYVVLFVAAVFAGPTVAALSVTAALAGKVGVKHFLHRYGQWRVGLRWYLLFLVGFPALYLAPASFWLGLAPWQALGQQWPTVFTTYLMGVLIFPALLSWGEEAGWRGFAQTHMQAHYGALRTSLVVGLLHSLWHLPVFLLVTGPVALGPFNLGAFLQNTAMIMTLTIIWTWIFNGAQQSILIAALMHAALNATQGWISALLPSQPEGVGITATVIIIASALLVLCLTKGRLGYTPTPTSETLTLVSPQLAIPTQASEAYRLRRETVAEYQLPLQA